MAWIMTLLLVMPMLILAVLIRLGRFAGTSGFVGREDRDMPHSPREILTAIDRDIAQLEDRLDEYRRNGGSGTWTARFAASCRRRRLAELRLHRQWCLAEIGRWRLSWTRSTAVCLDRSRSSFQTRDGLPVSPSAVQTFDTDRPFPTDR
jgi:hypothetical protein